MYKLMLFNLLVAVIPSTLHSQTSNNSAKADSSTYTVKKLYTNFKNPWGMVWLPDGRMLVTERAGEILIFKDDKFTGFKLSAVPSI